MAKVGMATLTAAFWGCCCCCSMQIPACIRSHYPRRNRIGITSLPVCQVVHLEARIKLPRLGESFSVCVAATLVSIYSECQL